MANTHVIIENVLPIEQFGEVSSYVVTLALTDLYDFKNNIRYNGDAQRGLDKNGNPIIDKKHVRDICESFLKRNHIRGHLTWNMKKEDLIFQDGKLSISKDAVITMPDSAHRHYALFKAYEETGDYDLLYSVFVIEIFLLNEEEEKQYFSTINGKNKVVHRNRFLYLSNEIECRLLREVIEKSDLKDKVEFTKAHAGDDKLVKFSTLHDAFIKSKDFKITEENYDETVLWLSNFFTTLVNSRKEFSQYKPTLKRETMLLEEITWWGYSYLAKEIFHSQDKYWKRSLKQKLNKKIVVEGNQKVDFFDKKLYLWHGSVLKGTYNPVTEKTDFGSTVINSNASKSKVRNLFINNLM